MKFPRQLFVAALLLTILSTVAFIPIASAEGTAVETTADDQTAMAITIYNDGTGLVKDTRSLNLPDGQIDLAFMDVAASMDPTSVHFVSNTNPGAVTILEQNYEYDLVSTAALYQKHIDKNIVVKTEDGRTIEGVLLAYDGNLVIQSTDGVVIVNNAVEVQFEELPEGLITRPTLRWSLINNAPGTHECEMSYLTSGLGWSANYVVIVGENDNNLDLNGWVTINNTSGTAYHDATLKLVAGEVHRVQPEYAPMATNGYVEEYMAAPAAPQFQEESFFEYHLY
ncbi:MAG: DUF4139 domain-containing protein, partial [bacterium]|nr:DUF4139 domain-containing protein [bacterium]